MKYKLRQLLSWVLMITMIAPNTAPMIVYGAEYLSNRPRYVDFVRQEALSLTDVGLGTPSDSEQEESGKSDSSSSEKPVIEARPSVDEKASPSDADIREPEDFYEPLEIDEPDGRLIQFNNNFRTYEVGERSYVTVMGGYSGLYKDEDGKIYRTDNTLVSSETKKHLSRSATYAIEENLEDIIDIEDDSAYFDDELEETSEEIPTTYKNASGVVDVTIPSRPSSTRGVKIAIASSSDAIEIIPSGGSFKKSAAVGNAIRYNNVYPGIDIQYTMRGETVKEDIILLEPTDQNKFSYQVRASGLKAAQSGKSIVFYKTSKKNPVFTLEAPYMEDAAGEISTNLSMKLDKGSDGNYDVSVVADKKWLSAEDRQYPVRIDPATAVPSNEFIFAMASEGQPNTIFNWDGNAYVGYIDGNLKNCRQYVAFNQNDNENITSMLNDSNAVCTSATFTVTTKTNNSNNANVFSIGTPKDGWNAYTINWNGAPPYEKTEIKQSAPGIDMAMDFDITQIMNDWITGKLTQAGLVIQADKEPGASTPEEYRVPGEILYNRKDAMGPKITVEWDGDSPAVDLINYPVTDTTVIVTPSVKYTGIKGSTTTGVLAHGKTTAEASVAWKLFDTSEGDTTTAAGELLFPDFEQAGLEHEFTVVPKSNWQSDGIDLESLETNTVYQFKVEAEAEVLDELGEPTGETEPSGEKESDTFLIYHVQQDDLVQRIAKHYQVNPNVIAKDNHLYLNQLTEMDTYLFIRNPNMEKGNYTFDDMTEWEELVLLGLQQGEGVYCPLGFEPINLNTGNFYMTQVDASMPELGGDFEVQRAYNSLLPNNRSEFGKGWSGSFGEHLTMLPDGRILFRQNDGAMLPFAKDGEDYKGPDGYDLLLKPLDTLDIVVPKEEPEEEPEGKVATPSEASDAVERTTLTKATDVEGEPNPENPEEEEDPQVPEIPSVAGWELTYLDGSSILFDNAGFMRYKKDQKGNTTTFTYNTDYQLTEVTTASGKRFDVEMDDHDRITTIGLPDGEAIAYEYDEDGRLVSVTNQEGGVRHYEYDDENRMTAWYDANGNRVIENTYDANNRVLTQVDASGNTATLEYFADHTVTTDNKGNVTEYWFNEKKHTTKIVYPDGTSVANTYDESGHLATVKDERGAVTSYTYDENGNILTETRDDGTGASFTYNELNLPLTATDYEGNTTSYTYDEVGNLLSMKDGEGNTFRYSYDEINRLESITDTNGGVTTFVYDGAVVVSMTDGEGHSSSFTYDEMNRVLVETDPLGHTTEHSYNGNGWEITTTNKDGGVTTYAFSPAGEVLSITDPMGVTTDFTYDKMYHITSGEDALGNTLTYAYDANYNKISETDAKGNVTTYTYDSRNRLIKTTDALGQEIKYTLDELGNMTESTDRRGNTSTAWYHKTLNLPTMMGDKLGHETYYTYDGNGNVRKIAYPDGSTQTYAYDRAGRVIRTTAQNGLVTEMSYDGNGNITKITDDEPRVYTFTYDHNNRLVTTTDPLGGVAEYTYDGAGNQIDATDAESHSTGYTYDAAGRLKEVQDALNGTAAMDYNLNGLTTKTTDQNGHATTYHYDVIGQLLAQVDAQGYVTAMEYDSLGNVTKTTDALKGEVTSVYDALNRTTKLTDPMGNEYLYEYDAEGNLLKVTAPDGDTISMTYDANGQMTTSTDEAGVISTYTYDSMGRVTLAKDNIGNQMTYTYDEAGNLVKQTDTIGRDAIYTYDKFNRPETVTGTDGATTTYGYDALDRLVSVTLADLTVTTYEYDKVGNLIKTTEPGEATYTYAYDAINRLSEKVDPLGAVTQFRYDAKGNLTGTTDAEAAENSYLYDAIDRLTSFTDGRGNATLYEYDELSRLLSHTTPEGNKQEYRYDANGSMTRVRDANGLITEYRYDVMGNLTEAISPKGAKTHYTYDKHDEVTSIQDPAGNLVNYDVDLNRRVTKITEKNGGQYTYSYDQVHRMTNISTPLGLTRTMTYDTADNVVKDTDSLGRGSSYSYDIMHRMTKAVDSKGGITNFDYDIRGNQNKLTDALGYTWNYNYDLIDQLTASVDPEGKATEVAYNLVGKVNSITKPGERTTAYEYDGNYNITGVIDPKGYQYGFTYDKDNRQIGTIDPLSQTTSTTYDAGSRVTSLKDKMGLTQSFEYDPHGNVLTSKATNGLITRFSYDILDNLLQVTMPSNLTTHYSYDVMSNVTSMTDTMKRVTQYTYDLENNMTSLTDISGRTEQMSYDAGGRITSYTSNGGNKINYDYDTLNSLVEKSYEDTRDPDGKEGVLYGYDALGQRLSMMDRSGESTYEYDGLGRITKVTTGSGEVTSYKYDGSDQLESITYPDGKKVSYKYDKNDNLTEVTDRTGAKTTYVYDQINRITQIHRPNGVSTYNTYNARDQIVSMKNICDDCDWVVSQYDYTYDDRGFITGEDAIESLYGYAWDDKHDGKHENWHDTLYPHGDKHYNKHDKDGLYGFQIIETKRSFEYDDDGKLLSATENEDRQGKYDYTFQYDDMGNRTFYSKSRNGKVQESVEYTYNQANQPIKAKQYDGKHYKTVEYSYDLDGNRIMEEEIKPDGTRKVEKVYEYTVENRLKAVSDKEDLLTAMAYDGDGNRIFQLNYNLHTDDDWKGNSGNGNGNNKDNAGSGNSGNTSGNGTGSKTKAATTGEEATENLSFWGKIVSFFTGDKAEETATETETATSSDAFARKNDKPSKPNKPNDNTSTGGVNDNNGNANGNTNNTGGSQNQSGILFPIDGEVSELESELIGMIKTTGKEKNYELVEYVNDVNREHTEVLMELNINGIMDTAYSYGDQRLTNERFTEWTGYYTYDPRGSVTGVTDSEGMIWQSYRYDAFGSLTFGQPQYNNVYTYNAESYNPNVDAQYLRARYYSPTTADFISEDSYLGDITDPLSLNRYNYVKSSPLNYVDPSGHRTYWDRPDFLVNYLKDPSTGEPLSDAEYEKYMQEYKHLQKAEQLYDKLRDVTDEVTANEYLLNIMNHAKEVNAEYFGSCDSGLIDFLLGVDWGTVGRVTLDALQVITSIAVIGIGLAALVASGGSLGVAAGALLAGEAVSVTAIAGTLATFLAGLGSTLMGSADFLQGAGDLINVLNNDPERASHLIIDKLEFFQKHPWAYGLLEWVTTMGAALGTHLIKTGKMPVVKESISATISQSKLKHINNRHNPNSYAQQIKNRPKADVLKELENKSFFNKSWSKEKIENAVNAGYNQALKKGISSGQYKFSYGGESITIALENGGIKTAFGDYKYTYQQLLELLK